MDEQLPALAGGSKAATTTPFYLALDHRASASSSSPSAEAPTPAPPSAVSDPSRQSNSERGSEIIKAKIMSHPLYPSLLRAFIDCRKVCADFHEIYNSIANFVCVREKAWFLDFFVLSVLIYSPISMRKFSLYFCYLRLERRRRLSIGFPPSPMRSK